MVQQLPKIDKTIELLEAKGKSFGHRIVLQKALTTLAETTDLSNPQEVELAIARSKCKYRDPKTQQWFTGKKPTSGNWKIRQCTAYYWYCKANKIIWEDRPIYHADQKTISIPTQEKVNALINAARLSLSLRIQISAETGLRPIEVNRRKRIYGQRLSSRNSDNHNHKHKTMQRKTTNKIKPAANPKISNLHIN